MRFMLFLKANDESEAGVMPSAELITAMDRFNDELIRAGVLLDAGGLHPTSDAVRVEFSGDSRTVKAGPFPATKDLIAGYWLIEAKTMDEASEWARRCPHPHRGADAQIEIRRLFEPTEFESAPADIVARELAFRAAQSR